MCLDETRCFDVGALLNLFCIGLRSYATFAKKLKSKKCRQWLAFARVNLDELLTTIWL